MRPIYRWFIVTLLALSAVVPVSAQQTCQVDDQSTEQVLSNVTLTWDSAFICNDAPEQDTYTITITITNDAESEQGVNISEVVLSHTTPRPGGQAPEASLDDVLGLPLILLPGESGEITVSGEYALVLTNEGQKANLHFRILGNGVTTEAPFRLGLNTMFRAQVIDDDDTDDENGNGNGNGGGNGNGNDNVGGPPTWVPGPPTDIPGPPAWVPGPPTDEPEPPSQIPGPPTDIPGPPSWVPGPPTEPPMPKGR